MKKLLFLITVLTFQIVALSQQRTHMPYSAYGLGDLHPKGFVRNMAMGRSGIALSSHKYLNNLNPASYHSIDSVSFFFDIGLTGDFVKYKTSLDKAQRGKDFNVQNVAFGFRINHNWSSSFGVVPYSQVGYKIETDEDIEGTVGEKFHAEISGEGGLTQFYWDNSYMLFNRLSLGVNFTYLFGNVVSSEKILYEETGIEVETKQTSHLNKLYANFGVQYLMPINEDLQLILGGIYGNSHKINYKHRISITDTEGTVSEEKITKNGTFEFPLHFGGGFALTYKNRLTVSADYLFYNWSKTKSDNSNFNYINSKAIRAGIEFIPGRYNQLGYFGGISYRAGFYHEDSYLEINGRAISDNGVTLGIGLPFLQNKTSINITYNGGVDGTLDMDLIRKTHNSIMVSLTLHDWWFLKRKID